MKEAFKLTYNKPLGKKKRKTWKFKLYYGNEVITYWRYFYVPVTFYIFFKINISEKNSENARQIFNTVRVLNMYL